MKPGPPNSSGMIEALQAELFGHLVPHGGVVALVGLHQATDLGLGRLALEELADDAAELFLLLGEGEVHGSPRVMRSMCARV